MFKYSVRQKITFFIFLFFIVISFLLVASINNQQKVYRSKAFESQNITPSPSYFTPTPAQPTSQDQETEEVKKIKTEIEELNNSLLSYLNEYTSNKQERLLTSMKEKAQIRKEKLLTLLNNNFDSKTYNPKALYEKAFGQETIDKFPQAIKENYLEQRVSFTGIVNTYIFDDFENKRSKTISTIIPENSQDEELQFYPADIFSSFLSGIKVKIDQAVKIKEEQQEKVKAVESSNMDDANINQINNEKTKTLESDELNNAKAKVVAVSIVTIQTPPLETLGKQKIFVFLAKLPSVDENLLPTPQEIKDRLNGRIREFYEKNSYGKFSLDAEVIDKWYQFNEPIKPTKSWTGDISDFYFNYFYRKILKQVYKDGVDFKQYDNGRLILIVAGKGLYDLTAVGGNSSQGKAVIINFLTKINNDNKEETQLRASRALIYLDIKDTDLPNKLTNFHENNASLYKDEGYDEISNVDKTIIHELGHSLGADHATSSDCKGNTLFDLPFNISPEQEKITNGNQICPYFEYGDYDVMGKHAGSFNAYIKTHFNWLEPIKIDIKKPDGDYTLKPLGENNAVAVWLPFRTENFTNKVSPRDYFLDYRRGISRIGNLVNRLVINLEHIDYKEVDDYSLRRTINFPATNEKDQLVGGYSEGQIFSDVPNNLQIKVKEINSQEKTLTVNIHSCVKLTDNPFNMASFQPGNYSDFSLFSYPNVFENDMQKYKGAFPIQTIFFIENKSDCFDVDYNIRNITVDNNSTQINEASISKNAIKVAPLNKEQLLVSALVSLKTPTPNRSCINITVEALNQYLPFLASGKGIKQMSFCINLVSSFEEYKNDFEPSWIYITEDARENCNKDYANKKEINNLTIKKGQNICFRSVVKNNSKNNKVGITSPKFPVVWKIIDKEGKDIIKPAFGIHESIPASETKESNVSNFSWTVPDAIAFDDYKVIYNVNSNRSLEEFNKDNNTVFRDFTVVEK